MANSTTVELTVYTHVKNESLEVYCEQCKPIGGASQKGTLVVSGYDNFCDGCGLSFKDRARAAYNNFCLSMDIPS